MGKGIWAAVAASFMLGAGPAHAKTWFVSPTGTGEACTAEAPCPIRYGAHQEQVQAGDEVVFRPGTYDLGDEPLRLIGEANVIVRGDGTGPVVIRGKAPQNSFLMRVDEASQVRDLHLVQTNTDSFAHGLGVATVDGDTPRAVIERVIVESAGFDAIAISHDALVRDSIAIATNGQGAAGISVFAGGTASLRNVTALAAAVAVGIYGDASTVGMRNSIARSTSAEGLDLDNGSQSLAVAYSSYRSDRTRGTITQVGTTHYADVDPLVDPATGRTGPESPLRDAGDPSASDLGSADVFGRPRSLGAKIDVGAVELLPASTVTTAAATAVGKDRATLGGSVDPGGVPVTVTLEVAGRTIDLGTTSEARTYSHEVSGLQPATDYTARLVATHEEGRFAGADVAFRTLAPDPPPPAPPVVTPPAVDALTSASLARTTFARRRSTTLRLVLARASAGRLTVFRRVAGRRRAGRCVAPRRAPRGRRCTRELRVSRRTVALTAGTTNARFRPRARRNRLLPAGRYVLVVEVEGKRVRLPFRLRR